MVQREETGGFEIDWTELAKGGLQGAIKIGLSFMPGGKLIEDLHSMVDEGSKSSIEDVLGAFQRAQSTVRIEQVQFLEQFRGRFEDLISEHITGQKKRLVVFVDDLDRCLPEEAIEVLEAIKLFLDVRDCVFVIAVDRKVIVEGIRVRYRDFALAQGGGEPLPISGEDFLEKIIQVPFNLPPVRRDDMVDFIAGQTRDLPEDCAQVFSLGIETNPRKIKRGLNVFWMHERLAGRRPELKEVIKPVRLAKVVVIQEVYPKLYADWVEAPLLLRHLEEHFMAEERRESESSAERPRSESRAERGAAQPPELEEAPKPGGPQRLVEKWSGHRALRRMLLFKAGEEATGFAEMDQKELEEYIYLTRTSAVSVVESEVAADKDLWDALLSGDRTRVESAIGGIPENERPDYVRRLRTMVESDGKHAVTERVSAGMALGFLGDTRFRADAWYLPDEPLLGFVEVPAEPFQMGATRAKTRPQWAMSCRSTRWISLPTTSRATR